MRVTVPFNIGMTLSVIGYLVLLAPTLPEESEPMVVEWIFPEREGLQAATLLLSIVLSTIAYMFIFRAVWNRLFPHLCGWKPINLAESYAFSIMIGLVYLTVA